MNKPKVSIVIPAYNHEKYIGETIQSVLDQTFQDFELIIINDGSTDHTEAEILRFMDERIRYYSQENRGLTPTLNRGVGLAQGEYFNFLPSDDAFLPKKLEIQLEAFRESGDIGVVFSYQQVIDGDGKEIKDDPIVEWFHVPFKTKEEIFPALFERNFLSVPTALIKMECFKRVGLFDESFKTAQDYDLWMRVLKYYDLRLVKNPLLKLRWHGENLTYRATPETELERAKVLLKAYKDLTIEDIFPRLHEKQDPIAYAEAYGKLASYIERSGLLALLPVSKIYQDCAKAMRDSKGEFLGSKPIERMEKHDFMSFKTGDRKINVLIEAPSLDKGGMEEAIYGIVTHLDPALFSPVVVCTEKGGYTADRIKKLGIPVEILRGQKGKEYLEILRRYQIDLVNSHFSFFGPVLAHRMGIPVLSVLHTLYNWYPGGILDEFRVADQYISKYIAVSNQVASFFQYRFNIRKDRIKTIPDGINIKRFESTGDLEPLNRKAFGWDEEDFIFLHVGAVNSAKMHNLLVAAMKEISKLQPKIKLISVGPLLDQDYYDFIQRRIEGSHLDQHMKLVGFVENVAAYYQLADAFLLPSLFEGWGIATVEAMYHGLPLILTRVGGAEELIQNQDIGILIENSCNDILNLNQSDWDYYSHLDFPQNTPELVEAMLKVYRDKKEWKEKARKGVEKVISHYTWSQIILQYEKEFLSLSLEARRERESFLKRTVEEQKERLNERSKVTVDFQKRLDAHTQEIKENLTSMTTGFQHQFDSINHQLDYILVRLSLKERVRERFFKLLKRVHVFLPKKIREKYRFPYRRFFFDKVFPEKKEFNPPHPPLAPRVSPHPTQLIQKPSGIDFFVFPIIDWEFRYQRPQQIAERLAQRENRIFYFRTSFIQAPQRSLNQKDILSMIKVEEYKPHIYLVTLVTYKNFNIYRDPLDDELSLKYLAFSLEGLKELFDIKHTISIVDLPFWTPLVFQLPDNKIIYDCMDEHAGFSTNTQEMVAREKNLLEKSVLVLASSKVLFQKAMACNKKTIKVKNAADIGHFTHLPESTVLNHVPKPILGYYGAISDWFDMELVGECAKANPGYHFILIGNTFGADLTAVSSFKNVHFLGEIPYQELPKYIRFFDVCLIPFKKNALTEATNPVKFYEYLSSGKPVVTTSIPELFEYKDVCYYSEDREAFIRNIKRALMEKDESLKEKRKRIASENSWDHRIDEIMESVIGLYPKMSIIIVTFNNLEYTKSCLESIFKYSRYPNYELIIVDNYSQDGTRDYLKVVQEKRGNVKIILNEKNKGFPAANNEGLKIAKGEYIVFLNNDTIVTHDWLYDLMRIINIHTRLGMIGPVSNQVGNIQKIPVGYKEMDEMQRWVQQYTRQQTYDYRSINMLGLFCSMVKRKVYEDVGGLDENYGIGCFEDDDYCKRVRKAGYELGYTKKVFIHHAGSVSFKKVRNQEYEKMWNRNKAYFEKKWGVTWSNDLTEFENIAMKEGAGTLQIKEYHQFQLNKIVKNSQRPVIIFYPLIDWNTPVFQRPPQMALSLSKLGYLVFFCTENQKYDKVEGFLEIQDHLYLTNEFDLVRNIEGSDITYVIYSTDNKTLYTDLNEAFKEGKKIIYEYIDEIHEAITGNVPKEIFERHKQILKNDEIIVVATADKLYQEVLRYRSRNCLLVSNGVDYDHFRNKMSKKDVPEEILYMVNKKKPIIGYYGSLASWFDYELVMELAHQRSNYEILLIGYSYDKSLSQYNFSHLSNLAIIGPVDYQFLPQYARWFDVAMIPFRINKITESTSPIKLFEYMAMGHPIVTTDMPECRKYKSVLIGKNRDEFIEKIDEALILKGDKQYSALLEKEAKENTWESRAQAISTLLVNSKK